jgi:arsenate reductase-like glutaredoxin family protein
MTKINDIKIKVTESDQKIDKAVLDKVNASIKGGKLVFTEEQSEERKEFQKLLDKKGYKLKDIKIEKVKSYPKELLYKEISLTQEQVVEEMKRIAVLDEALRLREMVLLSMKTNHEFYLLVYNPDRKILYEELQLCKDKLKKRDLKKEMAKHPMHLRYMIRDGYYTEMSFRESKVNASKRLYKEICEGKAKYYNDIKPLDYAKAHQIEQSVIKDNHLEE